MFLGPATVTVFILLCVVVIRENMLPSNVLCNMYGSDLRLPFAVFMDFGPDSGVFSWATCGSYSVSIGNI